MANHKKFNKEHKREYMRVWNIKNRTWRAEYKRNYIKTKTGFEATIRAIKKYESKHPERRLAWTLSRKIIKEPRIVCGDKNSQRHHPDIDNPMAVIFVCPLHHKELERNLK